MLKKQIEEALNGQINAELWSAQFYLSVWATISSYGYNGLAKQVKPLIGRSMERADTLLSYLLRQGGRLTQVDITDIPTKFNGLAGACEYAMIHAMRMSELIEMLAHKTVDNQDCATYEQLSPLILSHTVEECELSQFVSRIKKLDESALLLFDISLERG